METTDFAELRAAAAIKAPRVFVDRALLAALLAAHDARPAVRAVKTKLAGYPDEFEQCWAAYPKRPGMSKAGAYEKWAARLKAGATVAEMLAGTRKYAAYVLATRKEPQYIYQPSTFYGPKEHFSDDWTIPKNQLKGPHHGRIGNQDFGAGAGEDGRF